MRASVEPGKRAAAAADRREADRPARAEADVLGALEHAIAIFDADGRIVDVNRAWERVLGASAGDCANRDLWACFPVFGQAPAREAIEATRADGAVRHFDLYQAADALPAFGARVARTARGLLVLELSRAYDADDARDEEDRNEENAALRVLAKQMAEVSDSEQLLGILCDTASAQCRACGASVLKTTGNQGEIIAATGCAAGTRGRRFPLAGPLAGEAIQSRSTVSTDQFSGSDRPLARAMPDLEIGPMLVAPLVAHDNVLGVIAVVRRPQKVAFSAREAQRLHIIADHAAVALWKTELLEQAQAADHAKGRFLATISHELRTPLTALTGYEELLVDQVLGPLQPPQVDVLERMRTVTQHLTVMIEEVLAFSSLEAGQETVRPTEFLAADLLGAAKAIVEPLAKQKKLHIVLDVPHEPLRLTSDIDKLRQILVNLVGNAVKFTEHGEVRLAARRTGQEVRFTIQDTGVGIAPDDLRRLFRPFSQLDTGLTRRHGGTGLGLYISQRLARLLGGRIEVESTEGSGSTFTLSLPL